MKTRILIMLAMLTSTGNLFAQPNDKKMQQRNEEYMMLNKTEKTFRMPPHYEHRQFRFYLRGGHQLIFNFQNSEQALKLPDVDSLLRVVWQALQPFSDSFSKPLVNRRIDFNIDLKGHTIRFLEYPPASVIFRVRENDTSQLKVEQDTLSIRLYTEFKPTFSKKNTPPFSVGYQPFYITLLLNNITDLPSIPKEDIDWAVLTTRGDVTAVLAKSKSAKYHAVTATYNVWEKKKISLSAFDRRRSSEFIPYLQGAFQHVRGGWAPSVGAGMVYSWSQYRLQTSYVRLYWEPYFFFSRTADKKTELDRTDFIVMVYGERLLEDRNSRELTYSLHFSAGYAINTEGGWFEKNTFKFSFPGLEYRNVMLYPEFNFYKFFKGFNPSLKVVVNME